MTILSSNQFALPLEMLQAAQTNLARVLQGNLQHLCPQQPLPTAQWIEKHLKLPAENSDTPGDFDFYYVPHMLGVCAALDDPLITDIYCQKASQVAWTTILLGYLLSRIDQVPTPIIGMFSAQDAAREFSQEKLGPFVKGCAKIAEKMDVSTTRQTGNGLLHRSFPGGFLKLIGSNSVRQMKSTPCPFVFVEEPDDAAENAQGQGDSVTLLFERTKRFRKPKRVLGGTPSIKNFSRVEARMELSDMCVLPVECHGCGESHVLDFDHVSWLQADEGTERHPIYGAELPDTAVYNCPFCGEVWNDNRRQANIRDTVNRAIEAGDQLGGWKPTRQTGGRIKGFVKLGELYSCLPGSSVIELVEKHLEAEHYAARGDETKKIAFVNNQLGTAYEYEDGRMDADGFREIAKQDPESQRDEFLCPAAGLLVTAGVDVQHNRVAVAIRAWGRGDKSWLLHWGEIAVTSSSVDSKDGVWDALDALIFRDFPHESGASIFVSSVTMDSSDGATSDAVYEWVRSRSKLHKNRIIMAGKGSSSQSDPEIFVQPKLHSIDHKRHDKKTKAERRGIKVYIVGTNKAKDWIAAHMSLDSEIGIYHYYALDQMRWDYFDQMTGEAKIPHKTIRNRRVWTQKNGQAIEAWDCEVYALHAARAKRVHLLKDNEWDALERQLLQSDLFKTADQVIPAVAAPKKRKPTPSNNDYVEHDGDWL